MFFIGTYLFLNIVGLLLDKIPVYDRSSKIKYFHYLVQWSYQNILGISVHSQKRQKIDLEGNKDENILIISNHPSVCDFHTLLCFHFEKFPNHDPLFVLGKKYTNIPFFGKFFFKSSHIHVYPQMPEEELLFNQKYLMEYPRPFVLYVFPEGKLCSENNIKDIEKNPYVNLLPPKTKGVSYFIPSVSQIYDITLLYKGNPANLNYSLLLGFYPSSALILEKKIDIPQQSELPETFQHLWKEKDLFLEEVKISKKHLCSKHTNFRFVSLLSPLFMLGVYSNSRNLWGMFLGFLFLVSSLEVMFQRHLFLHRLVSIVLFLYVVLS